MLPPCLQTTVPRKPVSEEAAPGETKALVALLSLGICVCGINTQPKHRSVDALPPRILVALGIYPSTLTFLKWPRLGVGLIMAYMHTKGADTCTYLQEMLCSCRPWCLQQ